jgi:hypothetical protein
MNNVVKVSVLVSWCAVVLASTGSAKTYPEEKFGDGGMKKGPRTIENIESNVNLILPRIYYLYSQSYSGQHGNEGIVQAWFEVNADGKIRYASIFKTTLKDEVFEDLIEATLIETTFDKWKQGNHKTEIIYPLSFTKADAAAAPRSRERRKWEEQQKILHPSGSKISSDVPDTAIGPIRP